MSKTTQENKKKKAQLEAKQVEEQAQVATQEAQETETATVEATDTPTQEVTETKTRQARVRGKRYQAAKAKVDVNKYYPLDKAVELVKTTSLSKFDGKIEAHVTVVDMGNIGEITFPHLETASKKIVILNDTILAQIKDGVVDFDILIATPATMPKLLPFARVLGPKGLMPNPKSGTLTDDPEGAVKKLSVAKTMIKTEKKAPVVHIIVGKVSQPVEEISANIKELINTIKTNKIKKLAICATMGPSVKIEVIK
jgi:large subunit ribosomal protein L1